MSGFTAGLIYVHVQDDSGLPVWATVPLTIVGCVIAIWLLRGIAFLVARPGEWRLRRRVAEVHAAAEGAYPYRQSDVETAARRLFADMHAAWDAGDRDRLRRLADPDLMADWAKRLDGYQTRGKRQRIKVVKGPKVQYVSLLADRAQVRLRIRAKVRRRFEPADGPRKERRFGWGYPFEEFWTLARPDQGWILWSTRSTKFRKEYTTEPIVPPGTARPAPTPIAPA